MSDEELIEKVGERIADEVEKVAGGRQSNCERAAQDIVDLFRKRAAEVYATLVANLKAVEGERDELGRVLEKWNPDRDWGDTPLASCFDEILTEVRDGWAEEAAEWKAIALAAEDRLRVMERATIEAIALLDVAIAGTVFTKPQAGRVVVNVERAQKVLDGLRAALAQEPAK